MKNISALLLAALSFSAFSQTTTLILDQNNAAVSLSDNGVFFNDSESMWHGYEIPKGEGNHTAYSMSLWVSALDGSGSLHTACNKFTTAFDMFPGPIADDYESDYYADNFSPAIWMVSQEQIDYHKDNYDSPGYTADDAIANWPGNGDPTEGVAEQLAPYVDVNDDFTYDPMDGDYPYIQGDEAVFVILNDVRDIHEVTGGEQLGIEIHLMFYQFNAADDINNTTFMNATIYNRSANDYSDLRMGVNLDFDLGYHSDDFVGSDSTRNLMYVYNGSNLDAEGYGENPPAFGAMYLNHELASAMYYNNSTGANGDPNTAVDYNNYLHATWLNGAPLLYGGDGYTAATTMTETDFMFSGNPSTGDGWSEISAGNDSGDRRMVMSKEGVSLAAGDYLCSDVAFIYSRNGETNLENAEDLKNVADFVQDFYDSDIQPCSNIFVGVEEKEMADFSVYPNPATNNLNIVADGTYQLQLYAMDGQLIQNLGTHNGTTTIDLNLANGIYLLELNSDLGRQLKKIQIQR